ncbi:hypothetical protein GCM10027217_10510 [Pseudomaricurvus hydrocarbonicus]
MLGKMAHFFYSNPGVAGIVENNHCAGDLSEAIMYGRRGILYRDPGAVAADQDITQSQRYDPIFANGSE